MTKRDELVFLEDILEAIEKIEQYTAGLNEEDFLQDTEKQDAVIRRIEIMCEAVKNISKSTREKYPAVPWREMAGMRDIVIHNYFGVSITLVWRVVTVDIPVLKPKIERVITDLN